MSCHCYLLNTVTQMIHATCGLLVFDAGIMQAWRRSLFWQRCEAARRSSWTRPTARRSTASLRSCRRRPPSLHNGSALRPSLPQHGRPPLQQPGTRDVHACASCIRRHRMRCPTCARCRCCNLCWRPCARRPSTRPRCSCLAATPSARSACSWRSRASCSARRVHAAPQAAHREPLLLLQPAGPLPCSGHVQIPAPHTPVQPTRSCREVPGEGVAWTKSLGLPLGQV